MKPLDIAFLGIWFAIILSYLGQIRDAIHEQTATCGQVQR